MYYTIGCSFWILVTRIWPPEFGPSLGQIMGPPLWYTIHVQPTKFASLCLAVAPGPPLLINLNSIK